MTGRILQVLLMPDVGGVEELVLNRFVAQVLLMPDVGGVEELVLNRFVAWVGVEVP